MEYFECLKTTILKLYKPSDDSVKRAQSGFNISLTNKSNHSRVTPAP